MASRKAGNKQDGVYKVLLEMGQKLENFCKSIDACACAAAASSSSSSSSSFFWVCFWGPLSLGSIATSTNSFLPAADSPSLLIWRLISAFSFFFFFFLAIKQNPM